MFSCSLIHLITRQAAAVDVNSKMLSFCNFFIPLWLAAGMIARTAIASSSISRDHVAVSLSALRDDVFMHANGSVNHAAIAQHIRNLVLLHSETVQGFYFNENGTSADTDMSSCIRDHVLDRRTSTLPLTMHQAHLPTGTVYIGGQPVPLIFHTAFSDCVVQPSAYTAQDHRARPAILGRTFESYITPFQPIFGSVIRDDFQIADIPSTRVTFGLAEPPSFLPFSEAGGLCGMALRGESTIGRMPLFYELYRRNVVLDPAFAFNFTRRGYSTVYLGGYPREQIVGGLAWAQALSPTGRWVVEAKFLGVDINIVLDTAARFILMPLNLAHAVFDHLRLETSIIHRSEAEVNLVGYFRCWDPPVIEFEIAGRTIRLPVDALSLNGAGPDQRGRCFLSILGSNQIGDHVISGLPFFEATFVVFDVLYKRVGFGHRR
ncbi:hypothetical protein V8E36_001717 [Tilletia maclaganii]